MILIRHDVIDEITEAAEAVGGDITQWVHDLLAARGEDGPVGWRVLPCGCLIVEPLKEAIANVSAVMAVVH